MNSKIHVDVNHLSGMTLVSLEETLHTQFELREFWSAKNKKEETFIAVAVMNEHGEPYTAIDRNGILTTLYYMIEYFEKDLGATAYSKSMEGA